MKKLPDFQQTTFRAWVWIIVIVLQVMLGLYATYLGLLGLAGANFFVAAAVFWIDQLEKEVSRRNKADKEFK